MDIFLVRHGEAAASWGEDPDPGLSELGVQQAAQVAELLLLQLAPAGIDIVSSPLLRAQETAMPLAQSLSLPVSIDTSFREIPAPVALAGRKQWLQAFMKQQWQDQPQTLLEWRDTALSQIHSLKKPTVIFTHFLVLNAIIGDVLERSETLVFWPDNASVTQLKLTAGALELVQLGVQMDTVIN
jgi:broad specificity phosphatase PhoE